MRICLHLLLFICSFLCIDPTTGTCVSEAECNSFINKYPLLLQTCVFEIEYIKHCLSYCNGITCNGRPFAKPFIENYYYHPIDLDSDFILDKTDASKDVRDLTAIDFRKLDVSMLGNSIL